MSTVFFEEIAMTKKEWTNKGDVTNQSIFKMSEHGGIKFYIMLFFICFLKTILQLE